MIQGYTYTEDLFSLKKKKKPLKIICFEKYMKINRKTKGKFTDGTRTGDSYGYDGLSF